MANQIVEAIEKALADAQVRLAAATAPDAVEAVRIDLIGRKGLLPALSKQMGSIPPEERGVTGKAFNTAREQLQQMLDAALERLNSAADADAAGSDGEASALKRPPYAVQTVTGIRVLGRVKRKRTVGIQRDGS